ncbi:uncharacterized protein LOC125479302 isoform X2 [Pyrus x bretschneideri]|uniref:uncharacterized protein LOC125479302 isoform X2 n=1 Tax=Pyrus x bretschneideri TaxID=225117 RepID=UPI00202DEBD5|nr:uncharacterized protein LOC125479302 isoform X2 [Pyrus x bretschneideri]
MEQRETLTMEQRLPLFPCFPNASDSEIEVAKILINLPHMISEFETPLPIPLALVWGCKRKRSVLALKNDGGASTLRRLIGPDFLSSLPLWASLAPLGPGPLAAMAPPPSPVPNAVKEETSSPDTPLCFEPSESDEKQPDHLRSKLLGQKRKTEEWITIVDELTSKKKLRNQELVNVKRFFEKMDGLTLELKARKEEEEEPCLDTDASPEPTEQLSQSTQLTSVTPPQPAPNQEPYQHPEQVKMPMPMQMQMQIPSPPSVIFYQHQLQQLIMDQTAKNQRREINVGPRGGNFNLCFKDSIVLNSSQPFDLGLVNKDMIRKRAAEARQKRLEICRVKKPRFHSR